MPSPYGALDAWTRKCVRCKTHKPMAGGATGRHGKNWHCKDCKNMHNRVNYAHKHANTTEVRK